MAKIIPFILTLFLIPTFGYGQSKTEIKATLVYNIAQSLFHKQESAKTITVGVLHSEIYYQEIMAADRRDTSTTHIEIIKVDSQNIGRCDLLFLPQGEEGLYEHIRYFAQLKGIVLVTELPHLVYKGADISFYKDVDDKTRFKVNMKILDHSSFVVHRKLLAYGDNVNRNF